MKFEKVLDGIIKYINQEILVNMNDWQEVIARIAISRIIGNPEQLKQKLMENGYVVTLGIIDSEGNVDVEGLAKDLKAQVEAKGKVTIPLSVLGNVTFTSQDIDKLYQTVMENK
jgi:hypothetical protein